MSSPANAPETVPAISVVMAVYNGVDHVGEAIESILAQSFGDFEFIIVDDGSRDGTPQILSCYAERDKRILIVTQGNQGLTKSLNKGLSVARGRYIARQDADDVSYKHRFQTQVEMFERDKSLVLVGGTSNDVHDGGLKTLWSYHDEKTIPSVVYLKSPFPHSTSMFRAETARQLGGYDESYRTAQDMELWMRMARRGRIAMVREPVLMRRVTGSSISAKRRWRQFYDALRARMAHGRNPVLALYHSLRSVVIALLPAPLIARMKELLS